MKNGDGLNDTERRCWRHIAMHVATTGMFPGAQTLARLLGGAVSTAGWYRQRLVDKGYLGREGYGNSTVWRILIWPDGIAEKTVAVRVDGDPRKNAVPSPDDIKTMLRLRAEQGLSPREIAAKLGCPRYRVERALGLRQPVSKPRPAQPTKRRPCMTCGSTFTSEGPHNRVCTPCKGTRAWRDGNDFSHPAAQARGARA
jgi:hypothetical protein